MNEEADISKRTAKAEEHEQILKVKHSDDDSVPRDGLKRIHINAYSVGHFFNDLCAAMWFVYFTWYVITVVGLPKRIAGLGVLSGQITDGIMTPIVGLLSDRFNTRWGKRYPWYVMGTIIVFPSFLGIWGHPEFVNKKGPNGIVLDTSFQYAWYITLPAIFNVGWAMVQISHMAIVNSLTLVESRRDVMVNQRNGFTYAANITVLTAALFIFTEVEGQKYQFRYLAIMVLTLGSLASLFFMFNINEPQLSERAQTLEHEYKVQNQGVESTIIEQGADSSSTQSKDWKDWLGKGTFYIYGFVYMLVRVAVNVTMTVQPFYLEKALKFKAENNHRNYCIYYQEFQKTDNQPTPFELSAVPLGSYITALIFSIWFQAPLQKYYGNRMSLMQIGMFIIFVTSVPLFYLPDQSPGRKLVYPLVATQGIGLALILNTATSLISDIIGQDAENSAFVYGIYSLFDKFANGFLLYYIVAHYTDEAIDLRFIIAGIPVFCSIGAYSLTNLGQRFQNQQKTSEIQLQPF